MADGKYMRLRKGGANLTRLRPCRRCGAGYLSKANTKHCAECSKTLRSVHDGTGKCEHEKPVFANGRERHFCYACMPKPEPKQRAASKWKRPQQAICAEIGCGAAFTKKLPHERFCSRTCGTKAGNKAKQLLARDRGVRACKHCGSLFAPAYGELRRLYCSEACRGKQNNITRSGTTHRRRAKRFGCEYEHIDRIKVFERDGWRCYLCGCDTRPMRGTKDDTAPELEHVVPLSKGGGHLYTNVRCACRRCNREKGTAIATTHHDGAGRLQSLETARF